MKKCKCGSPDVRYLAPDDHWYCYDCAPDDVKQALDRAQADVERFNRLMKRFATDR